jgi:hypothetical protein
MSLSSIIKSSIDKKIGFNKKGLILLLDKALKTVLQKVCVTFCRNPPPLRVSRIILMTP